MNQLGGLETPHHLMLPRTMLIPEEMKLLYFLTRSVYSGSGEIVDAGAFCGGSAYALAAGLSDNPAPMDRRRRINSYDLFRADEHYTVSYLQNLFYSRFDEDGNLIQRTRNVQPNESFLEVYRFQTQRYSEMLAVHEGSFLEASWDERPVEILFIDVAKTLELQSHAFSTFGDRLMPGKTILIQQDYHHIWHPYIHVAMEYLRPFFEIVVSSAGATRAYRQVTSIPSESLRRVIAYDFSSEERRALLHQASSLSPPEERPLLDLVMVRQAAVDGEPDDIAAVASEVWDMYKNSDLAGFIANGLNSLTPDSKYVAV